MVACPPRIGGLATEVPVTLAQLEACAVQRRGARSGQFDAAPQERTGKENKQDSNAPEDAARSSNAVIHRPLSSK